MSAAFAEWRSTRVAVLAGEQAAVRLDAARDVDRLPVAVGAVRRLERHRRRPVPPAPRRAASSGGAGLGASSRRAKRRVAGRVIGRRLRGGCGQPQRPPRTSGRSAARCSCCSASSDSCRRPRRSPARQVVARAVGEGMVRGAEAEARSSASWAMRPRQTHRPEPGQRREPRREERPAGSDLGRGRPVLPAARSARRSRPCSRRAGDRRRSGRRSRPRRSRSGRASRRAARRRCRR